jgi:hypothetical protein
VTGAMFGHEPFLSLCRFIAYTPVSIFRATSVFRESVFKNLLNEQLPQNQIERFLDNNRKIEIAKTNNRSVLGSMNDLAFQLTYRIQDMGGLVHANIPELNHYLNRTPMSKIEEVYSIYELKSFLGIQIR